MRLELGKIYIKDIQFGSETKVSDGLLTVNKQELTRIAERGRQGKRH